MSAAAELWVTQEPRNLFVFSSSFWPTFIFAEKKKTPSRAEVLRNRHRAVKLQVTTHTLHLSAASPGLLRQMLSSPQAAHFYQVYTYFRVFMCFTQNLQIRPSSPTRCAASQKHPFLANHSVVQ